MGLTLRLGWEWRWNLRPASRALNVFEFIWLPSVKPLCILNKWAELFGGGD
jgi:hypothetical protein